MRIDIPASLSPGEYMVRVVRVEVEDRLQPPHHAVALEAAQDVGLTRENADELIAILIERAKKVNSDPQYLTASPGWRYSAAT